jgi:hypothetical protein
MAIKKEQGIVAVFSYLDDLCNAIKDIKNKPEFKGHETFSPTSYHEIEHAYDFKASPVRFLTLAGGLTGMCAGFALALIMDYDYPMVVGGKNPGIYSLPAYVIIAFELTILLGAFGTIAGMLFFSKIPNFKKGVLDERFTDDKFGIFVPGVKPDSEQAKTLQNFGADEIKVVGGGV